MSLTLSGDSLVLHCASPTALNKVTAVKKSIWINMIIEMKLTEEKGCWNFHLRFSLAEMRLNVLGVCITQAVRVLLKVFYYFFPGSSLLNVA